MNPIVQSVTDTLIERSRSSRCAYLDKVDHQKRSGPNRNALSCSNLAHGFAACGASDKAALAEGIAPNLGIITAYNDMLSAHQPYETFPEQIKQAAHRVGATAQVASGVPAMCDGVTQGQEGMELSLFSRDVIAMSAAIGLSHNMFDAAAFLGICDKIVPGLMIAALSFGHLPAIFIPSGPMVSGLPNPEKAKIRQLYAEGKVDRKKLLEAESASYHAPGTCTFYGTANTNQMLMEFMGLHLPGASFINPDTPLRHALTTHAVQRVLSITTLGNQFTPLGEMIDEKSIINGVVGLHATGGSTNHALHLVAIARTAGIQLTLEDIAKLSDAIPLLTRVYPNGPSDVNHFHAAGGLPYVIGELLRAELLHNDVATVHGGTMQDYAAEPKLNQTGELTWEPALQSPADPAILATVEKPFLANGGLKVMSGNIGEGIAKISAIAPQHRYIEAPALVFHDQSELIEAFKNGKLDRDFVAVLRFQGPKARGMPELHKVVTPLAVLQDRGYKVAIITDGRMSGATGKVPAAIHLCPEAQDGGNIAKIVNGDIIRLDLDRGELQCQISEETINQRSPATCDLSSQHYGMGRELFGVMRHNSGQASDGAGIF